MRVLRTGDDVVEYVRYLEVASQLVELCSLLGDHFEGRETGEMGAVGEEEGLDGGDGLAGGAAIHHVIRESITAQVSSGRTVSAPAAVGVGVSKCRWVNEGAGYLRMRSRRHP